MREVHGIFPQQLLGLTLPNGQQEGGWLPPGPPHSQVSEAVKGRSRLTVPLVTLLSFSSTQPV